MTTDWHDTGRLPTVASSLDDLRFICIPYHPGHLRCQPRRVGETYCGKAISTKNETCKETACTSSMSVPCTCCCRSCVRACTFSSFAHRRRHHSTPSSLPLPTPPLHLSSASTVFVCALSSLGKSTIKGHHFLSSAAIGTLLPTAFLPFQVPLRVCPRGRDQATTLRHG